VGLEAMRELSEATKTYYNPYTKKQEPVLTQEQVDSMRVAQQEERKRQHRETLQLDDDLFPLELDAGIPVTTPEGDLTDAPPRVCKLVRPRQEESVAVVAMANILSAPERLVSADMITLPEHYARFPIEPIRFCIENNLNGFQFNIIKYILRHDKKNGVEDLKKAQRYLDMFIKFTSKDPDWWKAPGA
jgi:hypothetical protein